MMQFLPKFLRPNKSLHQYFEKNLLGTPKMYNRKSKIETQLFNYGLGFQFYLR